MTGDVHGVAGAASKAQVKEAASSAAKENPADVPVIVPDGPPVMVVSGARVSTLKVRSAGEESEFPAASVAQARNRWAPWARLPYVTGETHDENAAPSSEQAKEPGSSAANETWR